MDETDRRHIETADLPRSAADIHQELTTAQEPTKTRTGFRHGTFLEDQSHSLMRHVAPLLEAHLARPQRLAMDEGGGFLGGVSPLLCEMHRRSAVDLRHL